MSFNFDLQYILGTDENVCRHKISTQITWFANVNTLFVDIKLLPRLAFSFLSDNIYCAELLCAVTISYVG